MSATPRRGRQTPTQSFVLPYSQTYGAEAVKLYNASGRTAQEWQEKSAVIDPTQNAVEFGQYGVISEIVLSNDRSEQNALEFIVARDRI